MSDFSIFIIGVFVSALCVAFVWGSYVGLREAERRTAATRETGTADG